MTSIVCQGLQSCLEPRLIEPSILRPKLTPPKSNNTPQDNPKTEQDNEMCNNKNGHELGWSFLKALTNAPQNHKQITETEKVYVHPLAKSSSSSLSKKSLEMCTEGLGSETGSDISESSSSDEYFSSVINIHKSSCDPTIPRREMGIRRKLRSRGGGGNFPPPLTSISSSESVRVRPPHREGGRLVIEAVTVSGCNGYFQAERGGGRLRLCLLKDSPVISDNEESYDDEEEEDNDDCDDEASEDGSDDVKWDEEGAGGDNIRNVGGEIANIVELTSCSSRPISRCKESGHGNNNNNNKEWGQFWVAAINS